MMPARFRFVAKGENQKVTSRKLGAYEKCKACQEFERACAAHLYLVRRQPGRRHGTSTVVLHESWKALKESADSNCNLCRCWTLALQGECATAAEEEALEGLSIIATSPETVASPLRTDVTETRDAHYFTVSAGAVKATLRLGGVSKLEFKALMNQKSDIAWARARLESCHASHGVCAELKVSGKLPTRLLSLKDNSLVDGPLLPPVAYAAISYCWGTVDHRLKLSANTESQLRAGVELHEFSKTVQDAIVVCKQLGIEYLWIDALCIRQDGTADWEQEARQMDQVYGNAHVTLSISTSASTAEGFLHSSDRPPIESRGSDIYDLYPVVVRKGLAQIKAESPTTKRGWIFQEELLSPRVLFLSHHGLFWSCSMLEDAENGTGPLGKDELFPQIAVPATINPQEFRRTIDPISLWDDMISMFSTREFSKAKDRLPAVEGLASLIATSTGERYMYGLWESRLPAQLLWNVDGPKVKRKDHPEEPTWSWASIDPARRIHMPKQTSARAKLVSCNDRVLAIHGRMRRLTTGLHLVPWPAEEQHDVAGRPRFPELERSPPVWAIDQEERLLLICTHWKQPIIIRLDNPLPVSDKAVVDFYDTLQCFEINYLGFLLLQPAIDGTYRRIGCAQNHCCSSFFDGAAGVDISLS